MSGWMEVIVGSMFSGKTEELIRRLRRAEFARLPLQVFKPALDNRYHAENVTSHNRTSIASTPVTSSAEILRLLRSETKVVGIDEAQFFDSDLISIAQSLAEQGLRVIVAGLDTDWQGKPFGPVPALMAVAEQVTKQHAVCVVCGAAASRTQRTAGGDGTVQVGAHDAYEARCRRHFVPRVTTPTTQFVEGALHSQTFT